MAILPSTFLDEHYQSLIKVLFDTFCPREEVRKPAVQFLHSCEVVPGFCRLLLRIISDDSQSTNIRLLAVIYVKGVVHRHWKSRNNKVRCLSEEEKHQVRSSLMTQLMVEQQQQVATQLSVVIAKISRSDFPKCWPNLFDIVFNYMKMSGNALVIERSSVLLHHIVKVLASKRMAIDKKRFSQVTSQLLPFVFENFTLHMKMFLAQLSNIANNSNGGLYSPGAKQKIEAMEPLGSVCVASVKVLYRFVVHGCPQPSSNEIVVKYLSYILENLSNILHIRNSIASVYKVSKDIRPRNIRVTLNRIVKKLAKSVYVLFFFKFEFFFVRNFVPNDFFLKYFSKIHFEPLSIIALNFLTQVLSCDVYTTTAASRATSKIRRRGHEEFNIELHSTAMKVVSSFFCESRIQILSQMILGSFLLYTPHEIDCWLENPEEFLENCLARTKLDSIRHSAESLLSELLENDNEAYVSMIKHFLVDSVMRLSKTFVTSQLCVFRTNNSKNSDNFNGVRDIYISSAVLLWDGVLLALGVSKHDLCGAFYDAVNNVSSENQRLLDFPLWFRTSAVPILQISPLLVNDDSNTTTICTSVALSLLKRRTLWVTGCWIDQLKNEMKKPLFNALLFILHSNANNGNISPLSVRLAAADTVGALINDWCFSPDVFGPFASRLVTGLYSVLSSCDELGTRLSMLKIVCDLCERLELKEYMIPTVHAVIQPLPQLWQSATSNHEYMMQSTILRMIVKVMKSMKAEEKFLPELYKTIVPLIAFSTELGAPQEAHLLRDGVDLWCIVMENEIMYSRELHNLFPKVVAMLNRDFEMLESNMSLIQSYILLGNIKFVEDYASDVGKIFTHAIDCIRPRGILFVIRTMETFIRKFPNQAFSVLQDVVVRMVRSVLNVNESVNNNKISTQTEVGYLTILARLVFHKRDEFMHLLSSIAQHSGFGSFTAHQILVHLQQKWLSMFASVGHSTNGPWRRKLWGMSLVSLLCIVDPNLLLLKDAGRSLDLYIEMIYDLENDTKSLKEKNLTLKDEVWRKQELQYIDPIYTTCARSFAKQSLQECARLNGAQVFERVMATILPNTLKIIQQ